MFNRETSPALAGSTGLIVLGLFGLPGLGLPIWSQRRIQRSTVFRFFSCARGQAFPHFPPLPTAWAWHVYLHLPQIPHLNVYINVCQSHEVYGSWTHLFERSGEITFRKELSRDFGANADPERLLVPRPQPDPVRRSAGLGARGGARDEPHAE